LDSEVPKQAPFLTILLNLPCLPLSTGRQGQAGFAKEKIVQSPPFGKGRSGGIILENLKKRIQRIKKKRPGYKEILDFYQKVREEQERVRPFLKVNPVLLRKEWKDLLSQRKLLFNRRKGISNRSRSLNQPLPFSLPDWERGQSTYGRRDKKD
jgi:hypothetical protein